MHGILAQEGGPLEVVFTATETTYLWVIFGISLIALVFAYYPDAEWLVNSAYQSCESESTTASR